MGPRTQAFEEAFAEHARAPARGRASSSCTAALHLAYLAAGVGPGDEVIVPSFTFAATAAAVLYCGGTPVFADIVGPHDLAHRPRRRRAPITPRTKAVCGRALRRLRGAGRTACATLCDAHGHRADRGRRACARARTLHGRQARHVRARRRVQLLLQQGPLGAARAACSATDDDDVAASAARLRSHGDDVRHLGPPHKATDHLRRDRASASTTARRAARGAAAVAARAPGRRTSTRRRELTVRYRGACRPARRHHRAVPRTRTWRIGSVLRDAGHARRTGAAGRRPRPPARPARRPDEHLLPGDPRVHRLPRALARRVAAAHRAGGPDRGDAPALPAHDRRGAGPRRRRPSRRRWRSELARAADRTSRCPRRTSQAVLDCLRVRLADDGAAHPGSSRPAFAEFVGSPHAVAVSSGTAALHLACVAAGVGPGDEVIVPALTLRRHRRRGPLRGRRRRCCATSAAR